MAISGLGQQKFPTLNLQTQTQPGSISGTATSQQAATAGNADVFSNPTVQSDFAGYNKTLGGLADGTYKGPDELTGEAEISALLDPAKAKDLLANGVKNPTTGQPLTKPIDPNSDLGKTLTKVANNQPVTADELTKAASLVKDKTLVSKSFMDNFFQQMTAMLQKAQSDAAAAMKKSDPGAV